ncbi:MAG: adenine deaminase [Methanotrichaceae archaeon]|nr:adenine deaminase [Methanotrichaceae archaeon]
MDLLNELISAARGEIEINLLIEGAEIANTLSGEVHRSDIAVHRGRVVGFDCCSAQEIMDFSGSILAPAFIDGHVHIESSMVTIPQYARAVVPRGTTSVIIDPHEIVNVMGVDGIMYMFESSESVPLNVFMMLPSCVPATDLETSGAVLDAKTLEKLIGDKRVLGLAELMNYPGVVFRNSSVLEKIKVAKTKLIDGHCPHLGGRDLSAYIAAGIRSDHECTSLPEATEKLRKGMYIMIREGSAAKNLKDLLPLVNPFNSRQFLFVSDDRHPADILYEGHIDFMVRTAIKEGLDPILALQIASLNAAQYFGLKDLGAIAPGFRADMVVLDDLGDPYISKVIKDGKLVALDGQLLSKLETGPIPLCSEMRIGDLDLASFEIIADSLYARVIGIVRDQLITKSLVCPVKAQCGKVIADTNQDIIKMAVIERHIASGNIGLGLVHGFGLKVGSIASSIAHDSHNIAVLGVTSEDMLSAVLAIKRMKGGLVVIRDGKIEASLSLPIGGLLSDMSIHVVAEGVSDCIQGAHDLGCQLKDPFMTLSFLCLPVIPELRLTDKGLVDVTKFDFIPLFIRDVEKV